MWRLLILLLPILGQADWDPFSFESEDPSLFHHVNVITGNLNLSFQDTGVLGAKPIPIIRTYSSSGALERPSSIGREKLKAFLSSIHGGWMLQGGWSLFPHVNLLIEPSFEKKRIKAHLPEPSGQFISYSYKHSEHGAKHIIYLTPDLSISQCSGQICARTNPQYNRLRIDLKTGQAVLLLPDGGQRIYKGKILNKYKLDNSDDCYYYLEKEILPSQHQLIYSYQLKEDEKTDLQRIQLRSPSGKKVYSSIQINLQNPEPLSLKVTTSDQKELLYKTTAFEGDNYLCSVKSKSRPNEITPSHSGKKRHWSSSVFTKLCKYRTVSCQLLHARFYR